MKVQFSSAKRLTPDVEGGLKLPYAPGKRVVSKAGWYVILAVVCSPLAFFVYEIFTTSVFVTEPGYVSLVKRSINSGASGRILELTVEVGDDVREGQVIATLEDRNLESEARRIRAELSAFEGITVNGPTDTERSLARHRLRLAEDELQFHDARYDAVARLFEQRAATRAELNNADAAVRRAQLTVAEVREALAAMDRVTSSSVDGAAYARLRARAAELDDRRRELVQRSPVNGRVLDKFVQTNEVVTVGQELMLIGEPGGPFITAYIDPKYAKYAQLGQRADIKLPNGDNVTAHIVELPEVTQRLPAEFVGPLGVRRMKILARLELDEPLQAGSSVDGLPVTIRFPFKI